MLNKIIFEDKYDIRLHASPTFLTPYKGGREEKQPSACSTGAAGLSIHPAMQWHLLSHLGLSVYAWLKAGMPGSGCNSSVRAQAMVESSPDSEYSHLPITTLIL